jgi:tetratricopeptide (TPR) repeat protein
LTDRLGYNYFLRGDLSEAERCYRRAAESDPSLYGPRLNLAKLALQRRHPDDALRELNQARLLAPRRYGVLSSLALLYLLLGQTAEANKIHEEIQQLREAAAMAPRIPKPRWPRFAL